MNPSLGSSYQAFSEPVLGDLDGDGAAEILAGSKDGKLYAFRFDGSQLPGWPRSVLPAAAVNTPAIGDIDGDGLPEVVAGTDRPSASSSNYLFAWRAGGSLMPGWPAQVSGISFSYFGFGAPVLADLDGDGKADVVASSDVSYYAPFALNAYRFDGAKLADFPRPTWGIGACSTNAAPSPTSTATGCSSWRGSTTSRTSTSGISEHPESASAPWPMFRKDAAHTGRATPSQLRLNLGVKGVTGGSGIGRSAWSSRATTSPAPTPPACTPSRPARRSRFRLPRRQAASSSAGAAPAPGPSSRAW